MFINVLSSILTVLGPEIHQKSFKVIFLVELDPEIIYVTSFYKCSWNVNENLIHLNAYPNPTIENITISIENFNGIIQTEVLDLFGNRLQTTNETTISLKDYSKGIYILKIAYGDIVEEVKVIKE